MYTKYPSPSPTLIPKISFTQRPEKHQPKELRDQQLAKISTTLENVRQHNDSWRLIINNSYRFKIFVFKIFPSCGRLVKKPASNARGRWFKPHLEKQTFVAFSVDLVTPNF